jgi:hypothetical protein
VGPEAITIGQVIDWVSRFGTLAFVIWALMAGMRGDWVFGWVHRDIVQRLVSDNEKLRVENQRFVNLALNGTLLANQAIKLAESTEATGTGGPPAPQGNATRGQQ